MIVCGEQMIYVWSVNAVEASLVASCLPSCNSFPRRQISERMAAPLGSHTSPATLPWSLANKSRYLPSGPREALLRGSLLDHLSHRFEQC